MFVQCSGFSVFSMFSHVLKVCFIFPIPWPSITRSDLEADLGEIKEMERFATMSLPLAPLSSKTEEDGATATATWFVGDVPWPGDWDDGKPHPKKKLLFSWQVATEHHFETIFKY